MSNPIIKVENLSKAYQIGQIGTGTISRDLERFVKTKILGKEDPFLKIGESNDQHKKGNSDIVWSLKDINFEINQGDAVGIIGKNGAGKSTLLKILSRITAPTTGNIKVKGRIASLLEVGTGFHPELSGRENIYLNGAILGMRKKEISKKLDQIIDFSGVERYIDTPVKRYSSGMYVRLAFAVAAHLESEILIVDEVLAVGDAEFQKKCLGKMGDISKGEGRTVLFVSHNMAAVQKICNYSLLLDKGKTILYEKSNKVIDFYLNQYSKSFATYNFEHNSSKIAYISQLNIEDFEGNPLSEIPIGKEWQIRIILNLREKINSFVIALGICDSNEVSIRTTWSIPQIMESGKYEVYFKEDKIFLNSGKYKLHIGLSSGPIVFQYIDEDIFLVISDVIHQQNEAIKSNEVGIINNPMDIEIKKLIN